MRFRQFLHNGVATTRIDSTDGAEFGTPNWMAEIEVAEALGVPRGEITTSETVGVFPPEPGTVEIPAPPAPPVKRALARELLDALAAPNLTGSSTAAEVRAAFVDIIQAARALRNALND